MLAAFSVAPSGGENSDASVHDAVAAAVEIVRRSGLSHRTDSMFTTIEGEWDEVFAVIKEATEAVGEYGTRVRSEEHTSELQSRGQLVCRLLLEKKKDRRRQNYEHK